MDLGLPSGTLWLDRLVGASSPTEPGLYYQWGAINGHTATDGYSFDATTYSEQGLDAISSNLSDSQDAAKAFYGPSAKMPSLAQAQELVQYTTWQNIESDLWKITSNINGESIFVKKGGYIENRQNEAVNKLRVWLNNFVNSERASSLHDNEVSPNSSRVMGLNIMAVHS